MASSVAAEFSLAGIDDVQDFPWQSGEGSSMSWERYKHLCDLMQLGNKAFRENRLDQLEKYELARDVICSGLQIDPQNNSLLSLDRSTANTFTRRNHIKPQRTDDYDCTLCLKLLYEPITTPCGILSADRAFFSLWTENHKKSKNAICKADLTYQLIGFSSVTLNNIIQKNFPEEYAERKSEHDSLTSPGVDLLPLLSWMLSYHARSFSLTYLNLVIDLCCEPLPDGRFFLEVESRRRCRIIRNWDQDGYRIAEVEWVEDSYPPEGAERDDLLDMTNKAAAFARQWIKDAQEAAQGDRIRLAELFKAEGMMPPTRDPERFSFWLATLTNRRPSERLDLLRIRDTKERIRRALLYMKAEEQGCRLQ
ncbi:LON peptidase N-terminal domain and RING finger protein 1 [Sesamum angolense]|uniref:LON peptidase N-terminal domain and RING finger protein 1 n=1 Tax=Sesamum angolense TaxID=2727404 RepID=A0AAE1WME6_9LAMI|nr:LON peptidase N-terminal domain and RING finger protein 1 [Sesamum angolense]